MLAAAIGALVLSATSATPASTKKVHHKTITHDQRMDWWRKARFGMFIHWGLYSTQEGEHNGKTGYAEWIMEEAHIPVHEYEQYQQQFNPVKFDADAWAKLAKDAGMKYVVITTKHHEGFALFDSKAGPYNVMHTPFHRDIMRELSTAVRGQGLTMGWYHSIMDWHNPDYIPARPWNDTQGGQKDLKQYEKYLHKQITELLTNYGPIGVMWFDGEWERTWTEPYAQRLFDHVRSLQPDIIINNRVGNSRIGSGLGDYSTPEQYIPPTGLPGVDWESCMTMNGHWGWNKNDHDWKSSQTLIHNLVDIASKGGNYLLNIGPKPDGTFPQEAVDRLHDIGQWMSINGESIYDTDASILSNVPFGRCTVRHHKASTTLYIHIFDPSADGNYTIPGLHANVTNMKVLGSKAGTLSNYQKGADLVFHTDAQPVNGMPIVVRLETEGEPVVFKAPTITSAGPIFIDQAKLNLVPGSKAVLVRYTTDGSDPIVSSPEASGSLTVQDTTTVKAAGFYKGERYTPVTSYTVTKVAAAPAADAAPNTAGLAIGEYQGKWEVCPDFTSLTPTSTSSGGISIGSNVEAPREYYGRYFTGYVMVPADGVYRFDLMSDDGSKLWIDDKVAVDNDGAHSPQTKSGQVPLAKGPHKIAIAWFNATGGADLALDWGLAGGKLKAMTKADFRH